MGPYSTLRRIYIVRINGNVVGEYSNGEQAIEVVKNPGDGVLIARHPDGRHPLKYATARSVLFRVDTTLFFFYGEDSAHFATVEAKGTPTFVNFCEASELAQCQ